jgi:hypothetical protein
LHREPARMWAVNPLVVAAHKNGEVLSAIQNENGVANDLATLCKWVREDLFYVVIHALKIKNDQTMSEGGNLCTSFVKCVLERENGSYIVNADIHGALDDEMKAYLKQQRNERKLSMEKTAVYAAVNDAFSSKSPCLCD